MTTDVKAREPIKVGDVLWYVPNRGYGKPREFVVGRVGRRWATDAHHLERIDLDTLEADGGDYSSPGQCYRSREEYEALVTLAAAWNNLLSRLTRSIPPPGVDLEWIEAAHERLGVPK